MFLGKNNKLWYYEECWYFITFIQEILGIVDDRTIRYIADDKKFTKQTQVIYFNHCNTRHFKEADLSIPIKEEVLDISKPYNLLHFTKNSAHLLSPCIKTNIDLEKYIIIYGESFHDPDHHIFWRILWI